MNKKKGITLVQFVCSIVVILITSIVLFCALNQDLFKSKNEFYKDVLTRVSSSGKEFFNDNKKYYPKGIFESQKVTIGTLKANNYLKDVKDYNKKTCSDDSYVITIKTDDDKYIYKTCLVCDEYSNMKESFCDASWVDSSTISYGIVDEPLIYISKGTSVKNKLDITLSIIKRDYQGNVLSVLKEKSNIKVSPKNTNIDVNKTGEYIVEYEYDGYVSQGKVIVYENPSPVVSIGYENIIANGYDTYKKETGFLKQGDWSQKIILTFNKGDNYLTSVGKVVKYQWNKDGKWQDICYGQGQCVVEYNQEMNQRVRFRSVDENNNYSKETEEYLIKIDNTAPKCEIKLFGSIGHSDWYISDVKVDVLSQFDASGIKLRNVLLKSDKFTRNSVESLIHSADAESVTYIGYVEDNAGNYAFCSKTFKKDSTKPSCTNSGDFQEWTNKSRTIEFGCKDILSGCDKKYSGGKITFDNTMKTAIIPSYIISDNAGNIMECSERVANIYVDKVVPVCTNSGDSTTWTNESRVISYGCSDNESGCTIGSNDAIVFNKTIKTTIIPSYKIADRAGNITLCEKREANIYVDKTKPTCTINKTATNKETGVDLEIICTDQDSGCLTQKTKENNITSSKTYTVKDSVGNYNTCTVDVIKEVLRSDAKCTKYKTCENKLCGLEEYDCSDCKTGANTCVPGYNYGKWGMCTLTRTECKKLENVECEVCSNGSYHARDLIYNECKTGENTCKYGCSTKVKSCRTLECGCEEYGKYGEYYKVSSCKEETSNTLKTKCKIVYK